MRWNFIKRSFLYTVISSLADMKSNGFELSENLIRHFWKSDYRWTGLKNLSEKWAIGRQTREQTFVGTFLWYEKSILGCWLWVGLDCGIKGLGRLWATFEGGFFNFLWAKKKKIENIVASALKSCIEKR